MKKNLTLIAAFFGLFMVKQSFSQTTMSDTSINIYSSLYSLTEENTIQDELSAGYVFSGDTSFSKFYITNPTDKKVVFNSAPTWIQGGYSFELTGISFPLTLEAKKENSTVQDTAFGTILFIPISDTTAPFIGKGQLVSELVDSYFDAESNTTIEFYYSSEINIFGFCYGEKYKNLGETYEEIIVELKDSCVFEVPNFAALYESDFIEGASEDEVLLSDLIVTQSVEEGTLFFSDDYILINYSFASEPGYYFSGSYYLDVYLNFQITEGYTCPYDSILPVKSISGNGGEGSISGTFVDEVILSRAARPTVDGAFIEGAEVYLIDKNTGFVVGETTTNSEGAFSFSGLMDGDYSISIKYNGYIVDLSTSNIKLISGGTNNDILARAEGGLITFSGALVTGLTSKTISQGEIQLVPNPVTDRLSLTMSNGNEIQNVTISDAHGKVISQLSNVSEVNTIDYAAGYYYLTIESKNTVYTTKFVKL